MIYVVSVTFGTNLNLNLNLMFFRVLKVNLMFMLMMEI